MWPCVSIARSYKGTRLLCWGERREKWMILEIFVSWSIRAISKLLKDIGRIFCATTGKVRKKLISRSRKLIITLHRVDRSPRFVPTQEGRPSLKISISIQWNGAKFRNIRGICQPHKGKIPVHPKFPNLHAHTSRETIPFPINETRVKASVQLNGSPLRPTTPPATKPHSPNMREKLIRFARVYDRLLRSFTSLDFDSRRKSSSGFVVESNPRQLLRLLCPPLRPPGSKEEGLFEIYTTIEWTRIVSVSMFYGLPIRSIISFSRIVEPAHRYPVYVNGQMVNMIRPFKILALLELENRAPT